MTKGLPPSTPEQRLEAPKRLRRILRGLLTQTPFFGTLALRMELKESDEVQNIQANGEVIRFNPRWIMTEPSDEIREGLAHVCLACALKHHTRRGERNYQSWQFASHQATLPVLREAGLSNKGGGQDDTIERIYDRLPKEPGGGQAGQGAGQGVTGGTPPPGEVADAPKPPQGESGDQAAGSGELPGGQRPTDSQRQDIEQEWDRALRQANQIEKATGKRQGDQGVKLEQAIEAEAMHLMSWRDILREFMRAYADRDYSWMRPNRRFIDMGLYLPSRHSEGMGDMVVGGDVSSSLDDHQLAQFWGVFLEMVQQVMPKSVRVIQCNTMVVSDESYDPMMLPYTLNVKGRGGTRFSPVFDLVAGGEPPDVLLYFTDLYCDDYGPEPPYPVIWVCQYNDSQWGTPEMPPWGRVIMMPKPREMAA